jgi:hypothetical protein
MNRGELFVAWYIEFVVVIVSGDFNETDPREQPINEMANSIFELIDESILLYVAITSVHCLNGLVFPIRIESLAFEQCFDYRQTLRDIQVEFWFAKIIAKNQRRTGLQDG